MKNRDIILYSDSQVAIKALEKTKINSVSIYNCNKALNTLANKNNRVSINWIPGHTGYDGNEIADTLAKIGSHSNYRKNDLKIPHKTIITNIKKHYSECHLNIWNFNNLHRDCSYPINCLLKKCNYNLIKLRDTFLELPIKTLHITLKIFTGHNNLNSHLYKMNMALDPLCEYCDLQNSGVDPTFCPNETAIHILEDCPAFSLLIIYHFHEYKINMEQLINSKTPLKTNLHRIAKFFTRARCFTKVPRFTKPISPRR